MALTKGGSRINFWDQKKLTRTNFFNGWLRMEATGKMTQLIYFLLHISIKRNENPTSQGVARDQLSGTNDNLKKN